MQYFENYIDGKTSATEDYLDVYEPATGRVYGQVANSTASDLEQAISAAKAAFPTWSGMDSDRRSRILLRLSELIEENLDRLAEMESRDTGKPLSHARSIDIPRAAANFRFFASAIVSWQSESNTTENALNYTRRVPIGVVGCISPWNLPLYLFTWKLAPALAVGNCVIGKPSELTPATATLLGELASAAGLPPGVLNILHGKGAHVGQALVSHEGVPAISFTGGTDTGRTIGRLAAGRFKKVSLELGGKNPVIVFEDCNLTEAVETSIRSAFANQGEICLCGSRILVEDSIYDRFKSMFIKGVNELRVGDPKEKVDMGALISAGHLEKVDRYVQEAKKEGAELLTGGHRLNRDGYFYAPTALEGMDNSCRIVQEEVFGPVVTLQPFKSAEEAIRLANSTPYGLAASIWTSNVNRAHQVAHQVKAGVIWINCWMLRDLRTPFGGMKASGVGREGGEEALRFFTETQNVCVALVK